MAAWTVFKNIVIESIQEMLPSYPFRLVGKQVDNLTFEATFTIKAKRAPTAIKITTSKLIANEKLLLGLSPKDRTKVFDQHIIEIEHPQAYIWEFPIALNEQDQHIFKLFLLQERKIICGSATHFIDNKYDSIVSLLSKKDVIFLTMAYYQENFLPDEIVGKNARSFHK